MNNQISPQDANDHRYCKGKATVELIGNYWSVGCKKCNLWVMNLDRCAAVRRWNRDNNVIHTIIRLDFRYREPIPRDELEDGLYAGRIFGDKTLLRLTTDEKDGNRVIECLGCYGQYHDFNSKLARRNIEFLIRLDIIDYEKDADK